MQKLSRALVMSLVLASGVGTIIGSGGTRYAVRSTVNSVEASNAHYTATLEARCGSSCDAFVLTVVNKTAKDLEIDWNRTLYVAQGTTRGGFMFEGVVFSQRNNPKPPDVVFANSRFTKTIYPNNLVDFTSGRYGGWSHSALPPGPNGVYLTVNTPNGEVRERLILDLTAVQIQ